MYCSYYRPDYSPGFRPLPRHCRMWKNGVRESHRHSANDDISPSQPARRRHCPTDLTQQDHDGFDAQSSSERAVTPKYRRKYTVRTPFGRMLSSIHFHDAARRIVHLKPSYIITYERIDEYPPRAPNESVQLKPHATTKRHRPSSGVEACQTGASDVMATLQESAKPLSYKDIKISAPNPIALFRSSSRVQDASKLNELGRSTNWCPNIKPNDRNDPPQEVSVPKSKPDTNTRQYPLVKFKFRKASEPGNLAQKCDRDPAVPNLCPEIKSKDKSEPLQYRAAKKRKRDLSTPGPAAYDEPPRGIGARRLRRWN